MTEVDPDALDKAKQRIKDTGPWTASRWRHKETQADYLVAGPVVFLPLMVPVVCFVSCAEYIEGPCVPQGLPLDEFLKYFEKVVE